MNDPFDSTHSLSSAATSRARHTSALTELDSAGIRFLTALSYSPVGQPPSHNRPSLFACSGGINCWVKSRAQSGLSAELIVDRLAAAVGAGPMADVINVSITAASSHYALGRHIGSVVGVHDVPGTIGNKEFNRLVGTGMMPTVTIDPASFARTAAFQSWTNAIDAQVLIHFTNGAVSSFDHDAYFAQLPRGKPPVAVVADIKGLTRASVPSRGEIGDAVGRIESLSESEILAAVSGIPDNAQWRASFARRLAIAEWLIKRQQWVGEVMSAWMPFIH